MNESVNHESPQMSGTKLRYGPDVLRLIESPDFRAHFGTEAAPIATKRLEPYGSSNTISADMVSTVSVRPETS